MEPTKNDVILSSPLATDYILGSATGLDLVRSVLDWTPFLPDGEPQATTQDTDSCATFSGPEHSIETQVNYMLVNNQFPPETVKYFNDAGYMVNGKFKTSALYNAKLNGTTTSGNYMNVVADSVRIYGLLPYADMPLAPDFTWTQFNSMVVTPSQIAKGKQILKYLNMGYQWISSEFTPDMLKNAPVQIAIAVCPNWNTTPVVLACNQPVQHCVMVYGMSGGYQIRDTYVPYNKMLAANYVIYAAMQYVITPVALPEKPKHTFNIDLVYGMSGDEVIELQHALAYDGELDPKYITGYFGDITLKAVMAFQIKYKSEILTPAGSTVATGKVLRFTRNKLNQLFS